MDNKNQITEGVIYKQLLIFFIPILIGSAFQQLYNTADTLLVGQFVGTNALAAVGAPATLINLLLNFFIGLAGGASVIIAQYYGAQNEKGVSLVVHTSAALCILFGLFLSIFGIAFCIFDLICDWASFTSCSEASHLNVLTDEGFSIEPFITT